MHWEINVSKNGTHYFATHERSLTNEDKARELYADFLRRFPTSEGFHIQMTLWESSGTEVANSKTS